MKKKEILGAVILVLILAAVLAFVRMGGGDTSNVHRIIGDSELYTEQEIDKIMDIVMKRFRRDFGGCTLTELKYDEEFSNRQTQAYAAQYGADRAIVLSSSFEVDESGGDGSLNPNSTYANWQWILTQTGGGAWILRDWGYG